MQVGSVYVFTETEGSWLERQTLLPMYGSNGDGFGASVALAADGATLIVGSPGYDEVGAYQKGAAYVFLHSGGVWMEQQRLTVAEGATNDEFGYSVALSSDGTTAIVGALFHALGGSNSGAAYVFTREDDEWMMQLKLMPDDDAVDSLFGHTVALSSDGATALVGAPYDDDLGYGAGSAHVFVRSDGEWTKEQELTASDGAEEDYFGGGVSLSSDGSVAVVGAPRDDDHGSQAGSFYVFQRIQDVWTEQRKYTVDGGEDDDAFGQPLSMSSGGATVLVGASGSRGTGKAYLVALDCQFDDDLDGFGDACDCQPHDPGSFPGAPETCDDLDNDCDGDPDEPDAVDAATWHRDADGDGRGDPNTTTAACDGPMGYIADATDCDDTDAAVWGVPGNARDLMWSDAYLIWSAPADLGGDPATTVYDTVRSPDASSFSFPMCIEANDGTNTTATDEAAPLAAHAFYYLVRAENRCGEGPAGAERQVGSCPECTLNSECDDGDPNTSDACTSSGLCVP